MDDVKPTVSIFRGPRPPVPPAHQPTPEKKTLWPAAEETPANNEEIVIRTMKDDLASVSPSAPVLSASGPVKTIIQPLKRQPSMPLPPVSKSGASVVIPPSLVKSKHPAPRWVVPALIIGAIAVIGVGVGWYMVNNGGVPVLTEESKDILEMVPANAVSMIEYRLNSEENRQSVGKFFAQSSSSQPLLSNFFEGDPRLLLTDPEVQEVYYVTLPQEPRPFLLVRATSETSNLLSKPAQGQAIRKNGWFIAHPVSLDSFQANLSQQGSIAGRNTFQAFQVAYAIRLYLSQPLMNQITAQLTQTQVTSSVWQQVNSIISSVENTQVKFEGVITHEPKNPLVTPLDPKLVSLIPQGASFIYQGNNFAAALAEVNQKKSVAVDSALLSEPAVAGLIKQLTGSFAFIQIPSTGGHDLALIVAIPPSLQRSFKLGDGSLERFLQAAAPVIAGKTLSTQLAFADGLYAETPLRYVNVGDSRQALDYALIQDNTYLVMASSKDSMFAVLDTVKIAQENPILEKVNAVAGQAGDNALIYSIIDEALWRRLFPGSKPPAGAYMNIRLQPIDESTASFHAVISQ